MTTQQDTGNIVINVRAKTQEASQQLRKVRSEVNQVGSSVRGLAVPLAAGALGFGAMASAATQNGLEVHRNREEIWRLRNSMNELGYEWGRWRVEFLEAPFATLLDPLIQKLTELFRSDPPAEGQPWWSGPFAELFDNMDKANKDTGKELDLVTWMFSDAMKANLQRRIAEFKELLFGREQGPSIFDIDPDDSPLATKGWIGDMRSAIADLFKADWWTNALAALDTAKDWISEKLTTIKELAVGLWDGVGQLVGGAFSPIINAIQDAWNSVAAKINVWLYRLPDWLREKLPFGVGEGVPYWRRDIPDPRDPMTRARERFTDIDRSLGGFPFGPPETPGGSHNIYKGAAPPVSTYNIQINALDPQGAADAVQKVLRQGTQTGASAAPTLQSNRARYQRTLRAPGGETFAATTQSPPIIRTPGRRGL